MAVVMCGVVRLTATCVAVGKPAQETVMRASLIAQTIPHRQRPTITDMLFLRTSTAGRVALRAI